MQKAFHTFKLPYVKSEGYHMLHLSSEQTRFVTQPSLVYPIPKGTFVVLNLPKVHEDERDWAEPEKFKPERFLDEDGKFIGWNKLHGFLPFGIGRRECPGQYLARVMMFSFSSILLHNYKFELPEGAEMPSTKVSTPRILTRPDDFLVVAKPRLL